MRTPTRRRHLAAAAAAAAAASLLLVAVPPAASAAAPPNPAAMSAAALQVGPGATGVVVAVLQDTLLDWGEQTPVDGRFTAQTAAAVNLAARKAGFQVQGLLTQLALIGFGPRAITMGPGDAGPAVATLQRALTRAGYGVAATGSFGPQTRSEVQGFQRASGLPPTGRITIWQVEQASAPHLPSGGGPAPTPVSALRSDVVRLAASLNGRRYAWGASGPAAFDCSGLTRYVLGTAAGMWLPHSSYLQWLRGSPVPSGHLRPGDLVFFNSDGPGPSHVGIYIGGAAKNFVDATDPAGGVQIDSLYNAYWRPHYVGGRSVLP